MPASADRLDGGHVPDGRSTSAQGFGHAGKNASDTDDNDLDPSRACSHMRRDLEAVQSPVKR